MSIEKIIYTDKEDLVPNNRPVKNKVVADDMNELKRKFNILCDVLADGVAQRTIVNITSSDFSGDYYVNTKLIGLEADIDVMVITNEGSGVMLTEGTGDEDGYELDNVLGRIKAVPGKYKVNIFTPITITT